MKIQENSEPKEVKVEVIGQDREVLQNPENLVEKKDFMQDPGEQERIRAQIEGMDLSDSLKTQAQAHANDAQGASTQQTIQNLLLVARQKGVVFAVNVAKKIDDPYLLDAFHDTLAKEGYYKEFLK